jgi:HAD superfamily hydrolase (TIGR01549 family)
MQSFLIFFFKISLVITIKETLGFSPAMDQFRAVLWDVDGTLADSYLLGYTSTNTVFKNNGIGEIEEHVYHMGTKYTTPRRLAWHSTGDPDHACGQELGKQFDEMYVNLVSLETAAFYDGIPDVLSTIIKKHPDVKLGALSNACGAYVQAVLQVNGVSDDFRIGLGADDVPAAKPKPDGLLQICEFMNILPSQCIYVGDSPSDGQAAMNCGMPSVGMMIMIMLTLIWMYCNEGYNKNKFSYAFT